jgi:hypothetical protein
MKAGEFLNKLATKSGITVTDKNLIDALSKSEFANVEINDELVNTIDSALMTVDAAKAHPDVLKKIKTEALNGADAVIDRALTEMGYTDEDIAEIKADKNTYSRIEKATKLIKTLESKKAGASAPDKAAFQKQIDDLNAKIRETTATHETAITTLKTQYEEELTSLELSNLISSKKLSLPDDMAPALKNKIALDAVKNDLKAQGFQIVKTNGTLEVKRTDGTDAYDAQNRKVDLTNFIDGALAQNKLLAVNNPNPPTPPVPPIPGQQNPVVNQAAIDMIDKQIAEAGTVA